MGNRENLTDEFIAEKVSAMDAIEQREFMQAFKVFCDSIRPVINDDMSIADILKFASVMVTLSEEEQAQIFADLEEKGESKQLLQMMQETDSTALQQILAKKPNSFLINVSKAFNTLFNAESGAYDALKEEQEVALSVGRRKKADTVITLSAYSFDDANVKTSHTLTYFDKMVLDAVFSYFNAGIYTITAKQIAETIGGNRKITSNKVSLIAEVENSLENMSHNFYSIDCTEQLQQYAQLASLQSPTIKGAVMNFIEVSAIMNGQKVKGYKFAPEAQALFYYAKAVNQIASVDVALLDVQSVSNTNANVKLKHYLIMRIEGMKKAHNGIYKNIMLFDTIFKNCQIDASNRTQRKRYTDSITAILTEWTQRKYIKKFDFIKKGNSFYSIAITV